MATLLLVCVLYCPQLSAAEPAAWRLVENDDGVLVSDGERKVLFFQRKPKSLNGRLTRANYVHPLYDLDGRELTEDFPKDHLHHRGIFWAWHQTWIGDKSLGDGWAIKDFAWDVRSVKTAHDDQTALLQTEVFWTSPHWLDAKNEPKPFVKEETTIRVYREKDDARAIDFEIRLLALEKGLRIGGSEDDKGYGGFSPRIRLPEGTRFLGAQGEVTPEITSVDAGAWLDLSARHGEGEAMSGVAILCHPSLPGFPQRWILRSQGSMQNAVFPGRTPMEISATEPLVLRYRLVVHRGAGDVSRVQEWHGNYSRFTPVRR